MRQCLTYPSPSFFTRIIGLTNRHLSKEDAHLPHEPRIELYSGMDLSRGVKVEKKLGSVPGIADVTHVYFAGG